MAWLYKHPRSQFWQIGWRVGNKLFNRSTKVTNRAQAEKKLALFDLMADASREKRLSEDFFNSLTGRELERIALRGAVESYLDSFKGQNTESSLVSYRSRLNAFLEYFHASDTAPLIGDITGELLEQFLNAVKARTTASTANGYRKVLNAFFAHALKNKKIRSNPVKDVATYKKSKEEVAVSRRPFEEKEIRAVYAAAPDDFWRFAIVFGLYTGLRLGNVTTLRWRDVDLKKQIVKVVDIKSPDVLEIPIVSPFLINLLGELRRKSPKATPESFLFPEYAAIYNADEAAPLSFAFRQILVAAGLSEKYQKTNQGVGRSCRRAVSPLSFHSLRHNFVTMLKERGASQMVARELVGHNSDAVNQLYTHTSPEIVRKSLKRLPEMFTNKPKAAK
jgi:integrase